jgi:hypothetical protein
MSVHSNVIWATQLAARLQPPIIECDFFNQHELGTASEN